jgi:transposase
VESALLKIDAQFPRFTQHLLEMVYPNYLAPTPSMAVVQFAPTPPAARRVQAVRGCVGETSASRDGGERETRTVHGDRAGADPAQGGRACENRSARRAEAGRVVAGRVADCRTAPTLGEEAARDLCRAREDIREDLLRARHRLGKFLLRRGLVWRTTKAWTQAHRRWLRSLTFDQAADQAVLNDYRLAVEQLEARLEAVDAALTALAQEDLFRQPVGWLRCFRGIDTLTAITLVAELHDVRRFTSARALMAYVGMVPSEHSSGETRRRGGITKVGNAHARRVAIEAAWHYRHPPAVGKVLRARRQGQPAAVIALADKALQRLHRRFARLTTRGKRPTRPSSRSGASWSGLCGPR